MANGFPSLLNQISGIETTISLLTSDFTLLFSPNAFVWGIYSADSNTPALIADSIYSFGYKKEFKISDYPVELGTFSNFNKVDLPYVAQVRMTMGGSNSDRLTFLNRLEEISRTTDLYNIVTPEKTYLNANIIDYDYQRTSNSGAGMIIADIRLMEVRLTANLAFNNTQSQSDDASKNVGQLSPSTTVENPPPAVVIAAKQPDPFPFGYHVPSIGAPLI